MATIVIFFPVLQGTLTYAVVGLISLAIIVELVLLTPAAVRRFRYTVALDGIHTSSGVLTTKTCFVPMQQLLVIEKNQGPILRTYGLVSIRLQVPGTFVDIDGVTEDAFAVLQEEVRSILSQHDRG
ncbi:PH domain-containing protein [Microbacterium sp. NPDC076768]|uniref:PH domain-containing protein n=1 Tax=Microbacterium sp. NPDC076768 TaxID=3154858 RepID=UPI003444D8C6